MVGEDADPDVLVQCPPEGVVARHDEEVGRLVQAGDDHLFGVEQLGGPRRCGRLWTASRRALARRPGPGMLSGTFCCFDIIV